MLKVVILAGGLQSTISDEQEGIPKPMLEINGKPILWHIMNQYSHFGFNDFIICGGYKVNLIKDYFRDYYIYQSDITVNLENNQVTIHKKITDNWRVTIVDTGLHTTTAQRVFNIQEYIDDNMFLVTYGDCLSNMDISKLAMSAQQSNKIVTMAVAQPTGRNTILAIDKNGMMNGDLTKPEEAWTNACTYVFKKDVFRYLKENDELDKTPIHMLAKDDEISIYRHYGFWHPIETKRDKADLEELWNRDVAPWKVW